MIWKGKVMTHRFSLQNVGYLIEELDAPGVKCYGKGKGEFDSFNEINDSFFVSSFCCLKRRNLEGTREVVMGEKRLVSSGKGRVSA